MRKSAAAKPTTKNEVGVRKVLKGSFQIASSKRPFPTAVTALIKERKIPDAIFIRRKILVRYLSWDCDEFVEFILGEKRNRCVHRSLIKNLFRFVGYKSNQDIV